MEKLIYKKSKSENRNRIIISFISIIISISGMIFLAGKSDLSFILLAFLFLMGLNLLIIAIRNKPDVTVSEKGISAKVNKMGLVEWRFIEGFSTGEMDFGKKCIVIKINDIDGFLKGKGIFSKSLMWSNIKKLGSPAIIPIRNLGKSGEVMIQEFEKYRADVLR